VANEPPPLSLLALFVELKEGLVRVVGAQLDQRGGLGGLLHRTNECQFKAGDHGRRGGDGRDGGIHPRRGQPWPRRFTPATLPAQGDGTALTGSPFAVRHTERVARRTSGPHHGPRSEKRSRAPDLASSAREAWRANKARGPPPTHQDGGVPQVRRRHPLPRGGACKPKDVLGGTAIWEDRSRYGKWRSTSTKGVPHMDTCRSADVAPGASTLGLGIPPPTQCSPAHHVYKAELGLLSRGRHARTHTYRLQEPHHNHLAFECEEYEKHHPILDVGRLPEPI
jgi:hypothetical protein